MLRNALLASFTLVALAGCDTEGRYDERFEIDSFARLESGLAAWFVEPQEEIVFIAPGVNTIAVERLFVPEDGERIVRLEAGPDPEAADELFVFTAPVDEREIEIVDSVVRIAPASGVEPVRFPLGARFGGMAFHPAGRFAILYHTASDADETGGLFNQNEVAVLDLSGPQDVNNPKLLTIGIGGRSVEGVAFPGPLNVAGVERDFVVFAADGAVVLLDLLAPESEPVTVKLKNDGDNRIIVAEQIVARPGDTAFDPMLILRAPGAQEIFAVALVTQPSEANGYAPALNQFDSGTYQPAAMALVEDEGHPLLVVAGASAQRITVIDVETANAFYIELDGYVSAVVGHTDLDGAPEVVMYGASQWIYFLAVPDLAEEKGSNLEEVFIEDGVETAWQFGDHQLLAVPYSGYGLTLIDLKAREVTRLTSEKSYSWDQADAYGDVLFYAEAWDDRVISLDLKTGHPEPLVLDEAVAAFEIFPDTVAGLVVHHTLSGRVTWFPLTDPRREAAKVFDGLWIHGMLDGKGVQP